MNRRARQAKHAAEHRHWRDRILRLFDAAPTFALEDGGLWYPRAEETVAALADRHGAGRPAVAGIIAALSPQQKWRKNVESADAILAGEDWRALGYGANIEKARRIADGANPLDVLGGDKVRNFFANLIGSREAVTVDVWAARAAYGRAIQRQPEGALYKRLARAYRAAAELSSVPPRELQAIVWLSVRPASEHARDLSAIGGICE